MPAATEAAEPTRKVSQVFFVANAAANTGARVETDPSIKPSTGLDDVQNKQVSASPIFILLDLGPQVFLDQLLDPIFICAFLLCEVIEQ